MKRSNFLKASLGLGVMSSFVSALGGELFRLLVRKLVDERDGLKLLLPLMLNLNTIMKFIAVRCTVICQDKSVIKTMIRLASCMAALGVCCVSFPVYVAISLDHLFVAVVLSGERT